MIHSQRRIAPRKMVTVVGLLCMLAASSVSLAKDVQDHRNALPSHPLSNVSREESLLEKGEDANGLLARRNLEENGGEDVDKNDGDDYDEDKNSGEQGNTNDNAEDRTPSKDESTAETGGDEENNPEDDTEEESGLHDEDGDQATERSDEADKQDIDSNRNDKGGIADDAGDPKGNEPSTGSADAGVEADSEGNQENANSEDKKESQSNNGDEVKTEESADNGNQEEDKENAEQVPSDSEERNKANETPSPNSAPSPDRCRGPDNCQECKDKADELFAVDDDETCAFLPLDDETPECRTVTKGGTDDVECEDQPKEMPSPTASPQKAADVLPKPAPDADSGWNDDDEGSHLGAIVGLLCLLTCGGAAFKFKDKVLSKMQSPRGAKSAKYHEVASEDVDDDEEWGWGDDDEGEFELASTQSHDSIHKRRTPSSESPKSKPPAPMHTPLKKASPIVNRSASKTPATSEQYFSSSNYHVPKLPTKSTLPPAPAVGSGLPLSKPGLSLSSKPTSTMKTATAPTTAPVVGSDFNQLGGMKITSLGPKRAPASAKKPPAPASRQEDDIFASMGFSAKPNFSHAPAPAVASKPSVPVASTASRWTSAPAPSPVVSAPAPTKLVVTSNSFDEDGNDANWGDDGDLDDLFDD